MFVVKCLLALQIFCYGAASQSDFAIGVQNYNQGQYKEAADAFTKAESKDPKNPEILYNLALTLFKLEQKGQALALLRKASFYDPSFSRATSAFNSFKQDLPHLNSEELARRNWLFQYLPFLAYPSLLTYAMACLIFLSLVGWLLLTHLGRRKRAAREDKPNPILPYSFYFLSVTTFIFLLSLAFKFYDLSQAYGTVLVEETSIKASPQEDQVELSKVFMGQELKIKRQEKDWAQVIDDRGTIGWIPKSHLMQTSGWLLR